MESLLKPINIYIFGPYDVYGSRSITTQFIQSISDITPVIIQQDNIEHPELKSITFVYSYLHQNNDTKLQLFGSHQVFSFNFIQVLIEALHSEIDGIVYLADNLETEMFDCFKYTFQQLQNSLTCPSVIVANIEAYPDEKSLRQLQVKLELGANEKIVRCNPNDKEAVDKVVSELLKQIFRQGLVDK